MIENQKINANLDELLGASLGDELEIFTNQNDDNEVFELDNELPEFNN